MSWRTITGGGRICALTQAEMRLAGKVSAVIDSYPPQAWADA